MEIDSPLTITFGTDIFSDDYVLFIPCYGMVPAVSNIHSRYSMTMAFRTDILQMAMYIEALYIVLHSMEWYQYLITIQGNPFTIDDDLWNRCLSDGYVYIGYVSTLWNGISI